VAFREYKIGARLFGLALGGSMMITLYMPSLNIVEVASTEVGLRKGLSYGRIGGFSYEDPLLQGWGKPVTVLLKKDPRSGQKIDPVYAYVYKANTPFTSSIRHPRILGAGVKDLSLDKGRIGEASETDGAVFIVSEGRFNGNKVKYIENATATKNWSPDTVLSAASDSDMHYVGSGKIMFVREGCWWCHTLLPEETQDWQVFGVPPRLGDYNSESPTAFGSDRKAPDLLHVGSRNSSKEWMMMHFFNPRLVQPHSIMPRYDYLWGEVDANGNTIDYDKWRADYDAYKEGGAIYPPEVPEPASDSDARYLLDFILSLK
jgi:cytochrome c oxidase cbb3-type subunit 2